MLMRGNGEETVAREPGDAIHEQRATRFRRSSARRVFSAGAGVVGGDEKRLGKIEAGWVDFFGCLQRVSPAR